MIAVILFALLRPPVFADSATASGGMAATVHPLATAAAVDAISAGGNAVDAAIAAGLMLGVVDGHNSGIGGGCFILIRLPDGEFVAIDGRETAPAKATRKMYFRDGKPDGRLSRSGPLASGVPGALAAYELAVRKHGRLPLKRPLLRAAERAQAGFQVDRSFASRLAGTVKQMAPYPEIRRVYLKPDGTSYRTGETLRLPDLAGTYRSIAQNGIDWFYRDEFADKVGKWMAENGGILSKDDFAGYQPKLRQPVRTRYRDYEIVGFPPPSSGGIHVAQILGILERFDLKKLNQQNPSAMTHVVLEAMKLAFADRAHWLGDSDFAKVPQGLIDRNYLQKLGQRIQLDQVTEVASHGKPPESETNLFGRHTTHVTVVDHQGYWVAMTQTINTSYGSKIIVPNTGVVLNNEMDDFAIAPGVPNAFGLLGTDANAVEPGKRPLSSMSPTMVLKNNEPILTAGAAGGPKIITQVVLTLIRYLDLEWPLEDSVANPRYHHQWKPDRVAAEKGLDKTVVARLRELGHQVSVGGSGGVTQAIGVQIRKRDHRTFVGVADPRAGGKAAGWPRKTLEPSTEN